MRSTRPTERDHISTTSIIKICQAQRINLTIAIDTVASANGSPIMFPMFITLIPPVRRLDIVSMWPFILRREGECSDP